MLRRTILPSIVTLRPPSPMWTSTLSFLTPGSSASTTYWLPSSETSIAGRACVGELKKGSSKMLRMGRPAYPGALPKGSSSMRKSGRNSRRN